MLQRRRHVFHVAGYDPVQPQRQYRRFARQLAIFRQTWNVETTLSEAAETSGYPSWTASARGPNWQGSASYELLPWDDIVQNEARGNDVVRLLRTIAVYFNLIVTGTLFRYALAHTRYFFFTVFPLIQVGFIAASAWLAASLLARGIDLQGMHRTAFVALAGLGVFFLLLRWPGRRWKIQQALDDWILSHAYIHGKRKDVEERLQRFAARLVSRVREGGVDEIVVVGHSLGAVFAIDMVSRALEADLDLGRRGVSLCVLTVGATIPKCALHPAATRFRSQVLTVAREPSIHWAEYQARADAISFYRFDPVELRRISGNQDQTDRKPVIRRVQIQDMLTAESFAKYRLHVLRLHYQFVMANDRRSAYDYFMMACGPVAFDKWTVSKLGFLDFFPQSADSQTAPSSVIETA